ncbi:hypothetical protein ACIQ9H_02670 [Aerococcus viridans]|uniref:hypothetical protein n=1 Tax=Aerococcus viridans TaxID=1377 RepID=UPI0038275333
MILLTPSSLKDKPIVSGLMPPSPGSSSVSWLSVTESGKEIAPLETNDEAFVKNLTDNQLPEPVAGFFLAIHGDIKNGVLDVQSDDFEKVLGKPLTPLVDAFKELLQ